MKFNTKMFNTGMFNGGTTVAEVFSTDRVVFEGFSVSDGTTMLMTDLRFSGPSRELVGGKVPRDDGEYLTADYFREFVIECRGIVTQSTAALLDSYLDTIKKSLRTRDGNLDIIDSAGTVKRFIATVDNFDDMFAEREGTDVTKCPWTIRFRCKTPFGKSRNYNSTFTSFSTSPTNQSIVHAGTTKAQPIVILNFLSASSITVVNVKRLDTDGSTLEEIEYSGTVAANDIFEFDAEAKTVKKNGAEVNYTGSFPVMDVGANIISVTVTGTSFSAECTIKHKTAYL